MASKDYIFRFTDGGTLTDLEVKINRLLDRLRRIRDEGGAGPNTTNFANKWLAAFDQIYGRVEGLKTKMRELQDVIDKGPGAGLTKSVAALGDFRTKEGERRTGGGTLGAAGIATAKVAQQRLAVELAAEEARVQEQVGFALQENLSVLARDNQLAEASSSIWARRNQLVRQLNEFGRGGEQRELQVQQRRLALTEREKQLKEALAKAQESVTRVDPQRRAKYIDVQLAAENKIRTLQRDQLAILKKQAELRAEMAAAELSRLKGGTREEEEAAQARQDELGARNAALAKERVAIEAAITQEKNKAADAQERINALEQAGGAAVGLEEIRNRYQEVLEAQNRLSADEDAELANIVGEDTLQRLDILRLKLQALSQEDLISEQQIAEFNELDQEAREVLATLEQFSTTKIAPGVSTDEMLNNLSVFQRTVLGAFQGMGRRFQATLQFAVSGALIFQFQRLVREFVQAALEVERSFADIETALEFDIPAPRGTFAFEQEVSRVREGVLQIANDFNVLPAEVNQAAFQMISRFQDWDAAQTATRAQVLATRIATIDQAEALRALTAVAEAYGTTMYDIADDTERQRRQAQIYADVLDQATVIQQQFGIAVEDSLEGAAGAAEVYVSLGLSQQQLLADAAALVRQTGQPGSQVQDRLQRFLSSIADPATQDKILKLASTTEALNLSLTDFAENPAVGLQKLRDQFPALEQESKALAFQLGEILGGERQLRDALAFLRTGELSADILRETADASGRAEQRLSTLLDTMQGSIEGIVSSFQELAQRLEEIGAFNPFALILKTGDLVLQLVNKIVGAFDELVKLLNLVRIPGSFLGGLGNILQFLFSITAAALTMKTIFDALTVAAGVEGRLAGFFGGFASRTGIATKPPPGIGVAGTLGLVGFQRQLLKAQQGTQGFGKTLVQFFTKPVSTLKTALLRMYGSLTRFIATISGGTIITTAATEANKGYVLSMIGVEATATRGAKVMGVLAALGRGVVAILAGIAKFAGPLLTLAAGISAVVGFFSGLINGVKNLLGIETGQAPADELEAEIQKIIDEADAAGITITRREARVQALQAMLDKQLATGELELDSFGDYIGASVRVWENFWRKVGGAVAGQDAEQSGTEFDPLKKAYDTAIAQRKLLNALLLEETETYEQYQRLVEENGGVGAEAIAAVGQYLADIEKSLDDNDPSKVSGNYDQRREAYEEIVAAFNLILEEFPDQVGELFSAFTQTTLGVTEITAAIIQEQLDALQGEVQIGTLDPEVAALRARRLQEAARQAIIDAGTNEQRIQEGEEALKAAILAEQQFLDSTLQRRLDRISLIEDAEARLVAELSALIDAYNRAIAAGQAGRIEDAFNEMEKKRQELASYYQEEELARRRFAVESARNSEEELEALRKLRQALWVLGYDKDTNEWRIFEMQKEYIEAQDRTTEIYQDRAIRQARLNVLEAASTQDNIAALQAAVAQLTAEYNYLVINKASDEDLREKAYELREAIDRRELALSERRAAFFRLTAGTGNEILAAQAELKAALDRLETLNALGAQGTQAAYEAELRVLQAKQRLADLALRLSDLQRRVASDLTNPYEQALLDYQAAQEALEAAVGEIEKLEAERRVQETYASAQREFYRRQLDDLDFLYRTDQIGKSQYIAALRELQSGIDRTTRQGEELWRDIELQIRGLMDSAEDALFNIPTEIRLPTLFEVRRALAADALGVDYQDNRQQNINVFVSDDVDVERVVAALEDRFGQFIDVDAARLTAGGAGITIGGFG